MRSAPLHAGLCAAALLPTACRGHGQLTLPPSRQGGTLAQDGSCDEGACLWFSQPAEVPGEPTVNAPRLRTYNVNVSAGPRDWSRQMPWRAPGTAPVYGSGCGSAGGGPVAMANGGNPPDGVSQGTDGAALPPVAGGRAEWRRGGTAEVAWRITANHGGGYSYRLCKAGGNVSEACFQREVLRFAGDVQWVQYDALWQYAVPGAAGPPPATRTPGPRVAIPLVRLDRGTHPAGSEWARNPIPGCLICDQADCPAGGPPNSPAWQARQHCAQGCSGFNLTRCYPGATQFPEPAAGLSGYTGTYLGDFSGPTPLTTAFPYNIIDRVVVPSHLDAGHYILSWRWDCEQSNQVWQNCADVALL